MDLFGPGTDQLGPRAHTCCGPVRTSHGPKACSCKSGPIWTMFERNWGPIRTVLGRIRSKAWFFDLVRTRVFYWVEYCSAPVQRFTVRSGPKGPSGLRMELCNERNWIVGTPLRVCRYTLRRVKYPSIITVNSHFLFRVSLTLNKTWFFTLIRVIFHSSRSVYTL